MQWDLAVQVERGSPLEIRLGEPDLRTRMTHLRAKRNEAGKQFRRENPENLEARKGEVGHKRVSNAQKQNSPQTPLGGPPPPSATRIAG